MNYKNNLVIKMNVGIIGGSDGLGKTLIYYFRDEFKVYISARDHNKGRQVANDLNVRPCEHQRHPSYIRPYREHL